MAAGALQVYNRRIRRTGVSRGGGGDPKPVAQIFDNVFKTFEIVLELFWCLITLLYSNFTTHARVGLCMLAGKYACV